MAENTIIHEIRLAGYKATSTGGMLDLGTWGSYGIEKLHLTLDAAWQDLTITAFFNVNGEVVAKRVVGKDGYADVPWEATKKNTFAGCLAFEGSINGQRRISTNLNYKVTNHSETTDSDPVPTEDRWNQFVTETKEYRDGAFEAAKRANARAEDAETASEDAQAAARAAKASENAAKVSENAAAASEDNARISAGAAAVSEGNAAASADKAKASETAVAESASKAAADAAKAASAAKKAADESAAAAGSAAQAEAQKTAAAKSASDAQGYMQTASGAATAANVSAENAAGSKAAAGNFASAAEESKQAAGASEVKAAASEQAAKASEQAAEKVRDDAKTAQKGAEAARDAAAKSAEAAAKSEANAKQSADTLAESVKNITPDDSSIGDKPWSSKHIVDMLCPPLEESGNPVVCYPVAGYPLGVKASWEPVQEGSGTPYPENIRPIKGRDSVTVERCGENLIKYPTIRSIRGIELSVDGNKLTIKGTCSTDVGITSDNIYLPDDTYTLSSDVLIPKGAYISAYTTIEKLVLNYNRRNATGKVSGNTHMLIYLEAGTYNFTVQVSLVLGTTAPTTYTPYIGQTNTLTLPETVYGGEVDAVTGESSRTWRTITLTGEENSHIFSTLFYIDYSEGSSFVGEKPVDLTTGKSSHYPYTTYSNGHIGITKDGYSVVYGAESKYPISDEGMQEWKAYLAAQYAAGTPVQVCYKLAEPVPFTATGAQPIPALAGVNTVLTDADSATVTGRADPIKRTTDLEDAVASQT